MPVIGANILRVNIERYYSIDMLHHLFDSMPSGDAEKSYYAAFDGPNIDLVAFTGNNLQCVDRGKYCAIVIAVTAHEREDLTGSKIDFLAPTVDYFFSSWLSKQQPILDSFFDPYQPNLRGGVCLFIRHPRYPAGALQDGLYHDPGQKWMSVGRDQPKLASLPRHR